jgi:ribosomal protein L37AE/L43A
MWDKAQGEKRMCPVCKSRALHRSQMHGVLERRILRLVGVRAFRCDKCDHRFYGFPRKQPSADGKQDNETKR